MADAPASPHLGNRALFPRLGARAYLSHAAIAPVSLPVEAAVQRALADYAELGVAAFPLWAEQRRGLRRRVAELIGASEESIALTAGTTPSISQLAFSLPWRKGDRVVLFRGEFPANVTPWQQAAECFGLEIVWLPLSAAKSAVPAADEASGFELPSDPAGFVLHELESALRGGVRVVAASAVQFQTGLRMPLAAMGRLCHEHGAELAVDAIQACGSVPLDAATENVDYLACGAHKWLLGLEGAGFTYVHPDRIRHLKPRLAGWLSHTEAENFLFQGPGKLRYDRPFKPSAAQLEGSSSNTVGLAALDASLSLLLEIGIPAIHGHVQTYLDTLEPALAELGCRSVRARAPACRSCILSVRLPSEVDAAAVVARLRAEKIAVSYPDGFVRFAPHFSNSLDEVPVVVDAVRRALADHGGSHDERNRRSSRPQ